ncbi:MAG: rod shape-determining protein MreD [Planctomycetes bacterium]|nr:rod shape-determining protein MreD [Planctomycetota bacterium]
MRYRTARLMAVGGVALILEVTALDAFSWGGARPELMLLLACFAALFARDVRQGVLASWLLGLLKDAVSAGPPGWHALLFLGVGAFLVRVRQVAYREHVATQFVVGAFAAAATGLCTTVAVLITQGGIPVGICVGRWIASTLLTALAAPLLFGGMAETKFLTQR